MKSTVTLPSERAPIAAPMRCLSVPVTPSRGLLLSLFTLLLLSLIGGSGCASSRAQTAEPAPASRATAAEPPKPEPLPGIGMTGSRGSAGSIADVVERALPSVVSISSTRTARVQRPMMPFDDPMFRRFFGPRFEAPQQRREQGLGSGVVVAPDIILTNNHVVEGAEQVKVTTFDGREFEVEMVGADPKSDVAVLRVPAGEARLTPIPIGDSARLRLGDAVIAIGNPFGVGQTVTMGIVSAKGRAHVGILDYEDFIQTDAAINPGNSGGALINSEGQLVGINTAILSRTGGNMGIGFAIPTNMARPIMNSILQHGRVIRGYLGVSIQDLNGDLAEAMGLSDTRGVLVSKVNEATPAAKAGIQPGDVITAVNGVAVDSVGKLRNTVAAAGAGAQVSIGLLRNGKPLTLTVTLGEMPDEDATSAASPQAPTGKGTAVEGLEVEPLTPALRRKFSIAKEITQGLVITAVRPGSVGAFAGLRPGDVVQEVNREPIATAGEFKRAWKKSGEKVLLLVHRRGGTLFLVVRKPKP